MEGNNIILNRFFTQSTINNLINKNSNSTYETIVKRYVADSFNKENREIVQDIYKIISKKYRNEYFYKNTLFTKLLLGRHSLKTTTALSEVPINKSKADFIVINGEAIVYEIKTELDTFDRLESQLKDYYKAFDTIYVITCESNYKKLNELLGQSNTGIAVLTKRNTISIRKKAIKDNSKLEHKTMFKVLRKKEFEKIILDYQGQLPETTQVKYYNECLEVFKGIDVDLAYKYMIKELKKRNQIQMAEYKEYVPNELKFLVYFGEYKKEDYIKLYEFLNGVFGR